MKMQTEKEVFKVHLAEYLGDDYWADYPPFEFASLDDAKAFAMNQVNGGMKLRDVTSNLKNIEYKEWFNES